MVPRKKAVFLDRDGTIVEYVPYLSDPAAVRVLVGAAAALNRLAGAGYACVVVTNQSAVGKGRISPERLEEIHAEMTRQLARQNAAVDAVYVCPIPGACDDPRIIEHEDRKPGPGMLKRAARELSLDLRRSWMVGDNISDVYAGYNAGCRGTFLIANSALAQAQYPTPPECRKVSSLSEAADMILRAASLDE